jgi:hypothetical protein
MKAGPVGFPVITPWPTKLIAIVKAYRALHEGRMKMQDTNQRLGSTKAIEAGMQVNRGSMFRFFQSSYGSCRRAVHGVHPALFRRQRLRSLMQRKHKEHMRILKRQKVRKRCVPIRIESRVSAWFFNGFAYGDSAGNSQIENRRPMESL